MNNDELIDLSKVSIIESDFFCFKCSLEKLSGEMGINSLLESTIKQSGHLVLCHKHIEELKENTEEL